MKTRNTLAGYSTIAPYGQSSIVVRLRPEDELAALDIEVAAMSHDMTTSKYVSRFTTEHEDLADILIMSREVYLRDK